MGAELKFDISKLKTLKKELDKNITVEMGIFRENDSRPDGKSNVQIGMDHEYGNPTENLPMRSWLKMPIIMKAENLFQVALTSFKDTFNLVKTAQEVGKEAEHIVKGGFESGGYGKWQGLSNYTIAHKDNSKILVDKGFLKNAVKSRVKYDK
jgi:hypothetical protein